MYTLSLAADYYHTQTAITVCEGVHEGGGGGVRERGRRHGGCFERSAETGKATATHTIRPSHPHPPPSHTHTRTLTSVKFNGKDVHTV